jgi:hypothetical protein
MINRRYFHLFLLLAAMIILPGDLLAAAPKTVNAQSIDPPALVYLPLVLKRSPSQPAAPILLASDQVHPDSLVMDSQNVYWTNCGSVAGDPADGEVMVYSKIQGISQPLASGLSCPDLLLADSDSLYWINRQWIPGMGQYTIFRMPKSGGQPVELAAYTGVNGSLAVDDTYVYWREYSGAVMRLPKTGQGTPQPAPVPALVFDGPDAYWQNGERDLVRSGKDGSSAVTLVEGSDLDALRGREYSTVSITAIYPKSSEIFFTVFVDNYPGMISCTDQHTILMRVPKSGGEHVLAAGAAGRVLALVAEPFAYLSGYCTNGILKYDLNSQTHETVATYPESAYSFAQDEEYIYWADFSNGWIKALAR